jgi:hypothetical protein
MASVHEHGGKLLVWDFDWSMVNNNCDKWVLCQLDSRIPLQGRPEFNKTENSTLLGTPLADLQQNWVNAARGKGNAISPRYGRAAPLTWTSAMHELFHEAAERLHTTEAIKIAMYCIPVLDGVVDAILAAEASSVKQIIISDANTWLLEAWLDSQKLRHCFAEVISNRGYLWKKQESSQVALGVSPLQPITQPHGCLNPCPSNMCKGGALKLYMTSAFGPDESFWPRVAYVGDGKGDLCPLLQLPQGGVALVRGGSPLDKLTAEVVDSQSSNSAIHTVSVPTIPCKGGQDGPSTEQREREGGGESPPPPPSGVTEAGGRV